MRAMLVILKPYLTLLLGVTGWTLFSFVTFAQSQRPFGELLIGRVGNLVKNKIGKNLVFCV